MAETEQAKQPVAELAPEQTALDFDDWDQPWGEGIGLSVEDFDELENHAVAELEVQRLPAGSVEELIELEIEAAVDAFLSGEEGEPRTVSMEFAPVEMVEIDDSDAIGLAMIDRMYRDMDAQLDDAYHYVDWQIEEETAAVRTDARARIAELREEVHTFLNREIAYMDARLSTITHHLYDMDHAVMGIDTRVENIDDAVDELKRENDTNVADIQDLYRGVDTAFDELDVARRAAVRATNLAITSLEMNRRLAQHIDRLDSETTELRLLHEDIAAKHELLQANVNAAFQSMVNAVGVTYLELDRIDEERREMELRVDRRLDNHGDSLHRNWEETNVLRTREETARNQINYLTDQSKAQDESIEAIAGEVERQGQVLTSVLS